MSSSLFSTFLQEKGSLKGRQVPQGKLFDESLRVSITNECTNGDPRILAVFLALSPSSTLMELLQSCNSFEADEIATNWTLKSAFETSHTQIKLYLYTNNLSASSYGLGKVIRKFLTRFLMSLDATCSPLVLTSVGGIQTGCSLKPSPTLYRIINNNLHWLFIPLYLSWNTVRHHY